MRPSLLALNTPAPDSFDATKRLATMTNQTDEFEDYITATQKMRAYRGRIEAGSPLAPVPPEPPAAPEPRLAPEQEPESRPVMRLMTLPPPASRAAAFPENPRPNLAAVVAIIMLSVAAIGLLIARLVK